MPVSCELNFSGLVAFVAERSLVSTGRGSRLHALLIDSQRTSIPLHRHYPVLAVSEDAVLTPSRHDFIPSTHVGTLGWDLTGRRLTIEGPQASGSTDVTAITNAAGPDVVIPSGQEWQDIRWLATLDAINQRPGWGNVNAAYEEHGDLSTLPVASTIALEAGRLISRRPTWYAAAKAPATFVTSKREHRPPVLYRQIVTDRVVFKPHRSQEITLVLTPSDGHHEPTRIQLRSLPDKIVSIWIDNLMTDPAPKDAAGNGHGLHHHGLGGHPAEEGEHERETVPHFFAFYDLKDPALTEAERLYPLLRPVRRRGSQPDPPYYCPPAMLFFPNGGHR